MMRDLCHEALRLIDLGEDFVCMHISEASGSTPREAGATMLLRQDGTIFGTIGGGRLEADAIAAGKSALAEKRSLDYKFSLSNLDAAKSDMICGGNGTVQIDFVAAADPKSAETFRASFEEQEDTLILFGAGHVSREIARAAEIAGFATIVIDDREEFANKERFPASELIVTPDMREMPALPVGEKSYVAIVTRGHVYDLDCLHWALSQRDPAPKYIGMIGSRRKTAMIAAEMRKRGHSDEALATVRAPIGLDIGAQTPGEIAISVVAQLIERRHGRA